MENVNCPIFEHAQHHPNLRALVHGSRLWTYKELNTVIQVLCEHLRKRGVRPHDRVAFIASSSPAAIVLFFALFRLQAIACPLSFRIPLNQLPHYFEALKPAHILDLAEISLNTIESNHPSFSLLQLNQIATFLFTSGSSGGPKIVCHTFGNHYYNAMGVIPPLQLETSSCWLLSLPLFHVSGISILFRCFLRGCTVVMADLSCFNLISELNISHISLVPTQLYRLFKEPIEIIEKLKHSLKCILIGGAAIPPSLIKEAGTLSLPLWMTYGMTEMASIVTLSSLNPIKQTKQIPAFRTLKIDKEQQIWVSGLTLFQGYWDSMREQIIKPNNLDWFATKDLGRFNADGNLEIIGRKDRQFISGGENIQPEEIERAICNLPGIRQASVLPIPDLEFGERPIAFIEDETKEYTIEKVRTALKSHLPSFMHPVYLFPYPTEVGMKPSLEALQQHLSGILKSTLKNLE